MESPYPADIRPVEETPYDRSVQLRYLYVGCDDTARDLVAWSGIPGARVRWRFQHFGADVAAIDLGTPPVVLLADHRPTRSVLPIYSVDDLGSSIAALEAAGWTIVERSLGTPEGPAALLRDISGTEIALLRVDRDDAMENAYADVDNAHRVL